MELLIDKGTFAPETPITGDAPGPGVVHVEHLGHLVRTTRCDARFTLDGFAEGSYAVIWQGDDGRRAHSAFDVQRDEWSRLRYGFVAEFGPDVDVAAYARWAARLHLTAVQFYDWAWRHEILVHDADEYSDALGRVVSNATVRRLRDAYREVGAESCAYAAVYAVDRDGWQRWREHGLFHSDGTPYQLGGDFLWILDPSDPVWQDHLAGQLRSAVRHGFRAFHLDQYGWPKHAFRADGSPVNLREAFPAMLDALRETVDARWMFNNVNDFPTEDTARAAQDATYIEVWDPHTTYQDLHDVIAKARAANNERPVILAAYLPQLAVASDAGSEAALLLAQATICSAGAQHLIAGGSQQVLVDPYYVNNRVLRQESAEALVRVQDLVVALGDVLQSMDRVDITRRIAFGINEELRLKSPHPIRPDAEPQTLWVRVVESEHGLTLHCINLLDQTDIAWNTAKEPIVTTTELEVSLEPVFAHHTVTWWDDVNGSAAHHVSGELQSGRLRFTLPVRSAWMVVHVAQAK